MRLFRQFLETQGGSLCCPYCHHTSLKRAGVVRGGDFPRFIYECRKCHGETVYDCRPASHYGDKENVKSHAGNPYKGFTRMGTIPPWLTRKKSAEII